MPTCIAISHTASVNFGIMTNSGRSHITDFYSSSALCAYKCSLFYLCFCEMGVCDTSSIFYLRWGLLNFTHATSLFEKGFATVVAVASFQLLHVHIILTNNSINWHGACCYSPIKTQSCPCLLFCTNELVIPGAAGYTWCFLSSFKMATISCCF